jgi:imidazolonepropionase-like amidohydrolase
MVRGRSMLSGFLDNVFSVWLATWTLVVCLVLVIKGGTIYTVTRGIIAGGRIVVEDGRITSVGRDDDTPLPEGAEVIHAEGMHVMPGMIDPHTHLGVAEQGLDGRGGTPRRPRSP